MSKRKRSWSTCVGHIIGHVIGGTVFFLVLCATSVGLSLVMTSIQQSFEVPIFTLLVLTGFEKMILVVDAVLFAVHFAATAVRALREIFR